MDTLFKWVQLSDLHFQSSNYNIQTTVLRKNLLDYLHEHVSGCDALILSGDYRYAPAGDKNPKKCSNYIMEIAKALGINRNQIIAVPGNHDLDRSELRDIIIDGVQKNYNPAKGIIRSSVLDVLKDAFEFYYELCGNIHGICALTRRGLTHSIIHLETCDVLILNTALTSGKDGESGHLIIGSSDLLKLFTGHRENLPIVAVGHHSLTELTKEEQKTIEAIFEDHGVNLYLCGHAREHKIRSFGSNGKEIPVGCIKQNNSFLANFVVGEISETLDVKIYDHKWDPLENGWFSDRPRSESWNNLLNEPENDTRSITISSLRSMTNDSVSLHGYRLLGPLGSDGISYIWAQNGKLIESSVLNQRVKESPTEEDRHISAYSISTSIGCVLAATNKQCRFCGTGTMPFGGFLNAKDIALQCIFMAEYDSNCPSFPEVQDNAREFAFMGQGEPGFNYTAIRKAIQLTDYAMEKLNQKVARYIISTCGITDFMPSLISDLKNGVYKNPVDIHFSLHEVGSKRQEIMPIDNLYNYKEFIRYCEMLYGVTRRKIGVGILMFNHYTPKDLNTNSFTLSGSRLRAILKSLDSDVFRIDLCAVNNTAAGRQGAMTSLEGALALQDIVKSAGFESTIFTSFGESTQDGCGMLSSSSKNLKEPGATTITHLNKAIELLSEAENSFLNGAEETFENNKQTGQILSVVGGDAYPKQDATASEDGEGITSDSYNSQSLVGEESLSEASSDLYVEKIDAYSDEACKEDIEGFFHSITNEIPSFHDFLGYVNSHPHQKLREYVKKTVPYLFRDGAEGGTLSSASTDKGIQELLYQLFLIDSGYLPEAENGSGNALSHPKASDLALPKEPNRNESEPEDKIGPEFSDVEIATKKVLKKFNQWLETDPMFRIDKDAKRQSSGVQYGYDVGSNNRVGKAHFRLCFECKRLNQLETSVDEDAKGINIRQYSANLLQFYMHCSRRTNNRWILVSPIGDLQNEFEEKLFEPWGEEHKFLQLFFITQNSKPLNCREFFSTDKDAFELVYPNEEYPGCDEKKVFDAIKSFIGEDLVGNDVLEQLSSFPFWENYAVHDVLLPVMTADRYDSVSLILSLLKRFSEEKDQHDHDEKNQYDDKQGIYIVGNAGTGKSWILYQVIEELIRQSEKYHLTPIFFELRDLGIKDHMSYDQRENILERTIKQLIKKLPTLRNQRDPIVFFLDGFDEVLSGLSNTDFKISVLMETVAKLKSSFSNIKSPLFVVTSRESDYLACKNHIDFGTIVKRYDLIQLDQESCTIKDIKDTICVLSKKHPGVSQQLMRLNSDNGLLSIMQRPFFYNLIVNYILETGYNDLVDGEENSDEFSVLKKIIDRLVSRYEVKPATRQKWNAWALKMTKENCDAIPINPNYFSNDALKLLATLTLNKDGKREIAFRHNIIREYFVGELLYNMLVLNKGNIPKNDLRSDKFLQTIRDMPLNPEVQRAFLSNILTGTGALNNIDVLKQYVCMERVKKDAKLSTTLLEILFQQDNELSGTAENPLNLRGIHTKNLFLLKCGLHYADLQNAVMTNMQLVDVMLSHLDLRNADLTGLQVFSDLPLIGATSWCSQGKLHIAAVNTAGQCIQYTMDGTEISSRYSTKIYGSEKGIEDEDLFPRFTVSNTHGVLVQCRGNDLYNLQEQSLLYKFSSNKKLYQIIPFREGEKDGAYILFKLGDYLSVASFLDNYAKWYDAFDDPESMMVFIDPHNIVSFQGGSFFLRDLDNDNSYTIIAKQCYDVQCFTAFKEDSRLSVVYKAKHSIGFLGKGFRKSSGTG